MGLLWSRGPGKVARAKAVIETEIAGTDCGAGGSRSITAAASQCQTPHLSSLPARSPSARGRHQDYVDVPGGHAVAPDAVQCKQCAV